MARATAFVGGLVCGLALGTLVIVGHADDVQAAVLEAARAANVDPVQLQGAVNTLEARGLDADPFVYLRSTGELGSPVLPPSAAASPPAPTSGVWSRLAQCESTGRWNANTGNGYFGGLQQDMTFWRNYGGLAYAPRPDLASPSAQVIVAERGRAHQGFGAWPACSRRLGLR
jgi:hypothetical protein